VVDHFQRHEVGTRPIENLEVDFENTLVPHERMTEATLQPSR
jgi:hypothetical protein